MALTTIELNDAGVLVGRDGDILADSPGYAVVEGGQITVGDAAYTTARLHPRSTVTSFWDRLSLEPVGVADGASHTLADVAYAHLGAVWQMPGVASDEVLLAVPGSFTREQLALLLGMAREAQIPVTGLVDAAVAAATRTAPEPRWLHLDIQLHRVVLTDIAASNRIVRRAVHENTRVGLVALREAWANAIADAFLRTTRFDPMHRAATEQALHARLGTWMAELGERAEAHLELEAGDRSHSVSIKRLTLAEATRAEYAQIGQLVSSCTRPGESVALLVSHRAQALPGLTDGLSQIPECRCVMLPRGAALTGAERNQAHIVSKGESLAFVTSLPTGQSDIHLDAPAGAAPPEAEAPTHVLYHARAYAIGEEPLVVGTQVPDGERAIRVTGTAAGVSRRHLSFLHRDGATLVSDHSSYGSYLNGRRIEGEVPLGAGDRIRIGSPGGEELQLITLVE